MPNSHIVELCDVTLMAGDRALAEGITSLLALVRYMPSWVRLEQVSRPYCGPPWG